MRAAPSPEGFSVPGQPPVGAGAASVFPSARKMERPPFEAPEWSYSLAWEATCPKCPKPEVHNAENYPCPTCGGWVVVKLTFKDFSSTKPFRMKLTCSRNDDY